ncbi:DUF5681 domain-containing protein [Spirosoma aerophilum]
MPNNPNAADNLKPFKPGESGNLDGRPKGSISQWMKEFGEATKIELRLTVTDIEGKVSESSSTIATDGNVTINQAIAVRGLQKALKGDYQFFREVLNRTEGRVPQPITGADGGPIQVDDVTRLTPDELRRRIAALRNRASDQAAG